MKKIWCLAFLFTISLSLLAQQQVINQKFTSKELYGVRDLKIYLPEGYKEETHNYPLAIVIDTDNLFNLYVENAKLFASKDRAPKQVVVGISLDKTKEEDIYYDKDTYRLTGGNVKFINFIKKEIISFIEKNYRISPFITIVGEGMAANIITAFLNEDTSLFNAYVCINPIFPPTITEKVSSYQVYRFGKEDNQFYYYLNNLPFYSKSEKKALTMLKTYFNSLSAKNFHFKYDDMNSPNYLSAMSEAIPRAINVIFELYRGISEKEYNEKIKNLSPQEAIAYLEKKYLEIDYLFGVDLGIRIKDIYAIENIVIDREGGRYLLDFGEMIVNVYPKSHIGDYYIGLYYEKQNQRDLALEYYKKAYGKMNDSDPKKELFYGNIKRLSGK
ncbi:alpha/beta hydrolase-fold protein [Tenacibaculum sp. UWU-22]|uniref:alpha/beta hydrolase-fold protein n=1 Tax=Tenacibaculum sp. UWU-22 TaxID=3234187 RepID=UPI0034DB5A32